MIFGGPTRALDVLRAIDEYHRAWGWWPAIRDLNEALGLRSTSTVVYHLQTLEFHGWLVLGGHRMSRAMRITAEGRVALEAHRLEREAARV